MGIPEATLRPWTNQGAVDTSARTYASIREALSQHDWPAGMSYDPYLQGSYANSTNIRGDSDVDLVVETDDVFYSNLTEAEKTQLRISRGRFTWTEFRQEVAEALTNYYGADLVDDTRGKCIAVSAHGNLLAADVVPAVEYRKYDQLVVEASGMTFWTRRGNHQVINYPKIHKANGTTKNAQTNERYKPSVRMFKNARNKITGANQADGTNRFPSYFTECLLYNVPNVTFRRSPADTYVSVVKALDTMRTNGTLSTRLTQSERESLFGGGRMQWRLDEASALIDGLIDLWNNWS